MMKLRLLLLASVPALAVSCGEPEYSWHPIKADGSRTGVTFALAGKASQCIGTISDGVYTSPSGRQFSSGAALAEAQVMLGLQEKMQEPKRVVGFCPEVMRRKGDHPALANLVVDCLMLGVSESCGRKVDVGFVNVGGLRVDFPQGDLLMDDLRSLLPFENHIVLALIKGSNLRKLFAQMAENGIQCIGGASVTFQDKKLVSVQVGGKPLDDSRLYRLATIDFLLDGGDYFRIAELAESVRIYEVMVREPFNKYIFGETAAGRPISYTDEQRITVL